MAAQPLEVFDVEVPVGANTYRRPFVITRIDGSFVFGFPLSTKVSTFFNPVYDFAISDNDPDFKFTGLTAASFVIGVNEYQIDVKALKNQRGKLRGELAARFLKWYGP